MFRVVLQENPQWKEPWVTKFAFDLILLHILKEWCSKFLFLKVIWQKLFWKKKLYKENDMDFGGKQSCILFCCFSTVWLRINFPVHKKETMLSPDLSIRTVPGSFNLRARDLSSAEYIWCGKDNTNDTITFSMLM